jgi:Ty3 transposon capsid-like protein
MAGLTSHSQSSSQPGGKRKSVRKIKPYDGESQSLRSFLTAIELQMENDGIVGSDNKVKYVGNYLEGKAWNWFEPIVRERNQFQREY